MKSLYILPALLLAVSCSKSSDYFAKSQPVEDIKQPICNDSSCEPNPNPCSGADCNPGPGTGPNPVPVIVTKTFTQNERRKLDLVWVVDDSKSMEDEQNSLADNFKDFVEDFVTTKIDFKMAITTTDARIPTDTSTADRCGVMVAGSDTKLTLEKATLNKTLFIEDFSNLIKVGLAGSGKEQGLQGAKCFLERNPAFVRSDAYLVFVMISDEQDQSKLDQAQAEYTPVQSYLDIFKQRKSAELLRIHSIVDKSLVNANVSGVTAGFSRYAEASIGTGGEVKDINLAFGETLSQLSNKIMVLIDSFELGDKPKLDTIKVYVNGELEPASSYVYNDGSNSIKFKDGSIPDVGAQIKIVFEKQI